MVSERTVGLCDILGFRRAIKKWGTAKVVQEYRNLFIGSIYHSVFQKAPPEPMPSLGSLRDNANLGFTWFSDTALFFSLDSTQGSLRRVVEAVSWVLSDCIFRGMPVRAAVAWGDMEVDEEAGTYVGRALVDAYELEQDQDWMGGALTDAASERVPPECIGLAEWQVVEYSIPLKTGGPRSGLAVDWTTCVHLPFTDLSQKFDVSKVPISKLKNASAFHRTVCRFCRPNAERG